MPMYLDIHGGGWWMGNGFPFHAMVTRFANTSGAIVVSVDYRLAPEHPFPAGFDDCYSVLLWMYDNAAALGADPERIAVGGASAGGNLAAALTLRSRDEGGPRLAYQFLLVPATDISGTRHYDSYQLAGEDYVLKQSGLKKMIAAYVPDPEQRSQPYASPLLAENHSGLPPAFIVTAQYDPLHDEGNAYAEALKAAGVPVRLYDEQGVIHGLLGSNERSVQLHEMAALAVKEHLQKPL